MENLFGERRNNLENGEWRMENGELIWKTENGGWRTEN